MRKFVLAALVFAGCSQPNGVPVSPGQECMAVDPSGDEVVIMYPLVRDGSTRLELDGIPNGTRVRLVDPAKSIPKAGMMASVLILEGSHSGGTAYLRPKYLRPLP